MESAALADGASPDVASHLDGQCNLVSAVRVANRTSMSKKENTALASGVSSIVSRMMLKRTGPVHTNIANPTWMSSEDGRDVEICIIQPPRGLEPLGHGMTGPVPHHADGLRAILT